MLPRIEVYGRPRFPWFKKYFIKKESYLPYGFDGTSEWMDENKGLFE